MSPTHSMVRTAVFLCECLTSFMNGSALSMPVLRAFRSRASQKPQCFFVQQPVAGNDIGPVNGRRAVPIAEAAAGFFDDGLDRGNVPNMDAVFYHELARPLGDEQEAIEVAETALPL